NDIGWAIRKRREIERPDLTYSRAADLICERGRFGQKTGAGWYDYKPGDRTAHPSAVMEELIREHARGLGLKARKISDAEIVERLMSDAVIVSTARTGLARSWKGALNMTHGATLGAHVVRHAVVRAGLEPSEIEDVLMGCALPEGATGGNIARHIALRAELPV